MSRNVTEESLVNWQENEYLDDDLHCYFEGKDQRDWTDVKDEWLRTHNLMFGASVHSSSAESLLASAAIAQAFHGAMMYVSSALGVEETVLLMALENCADGSCRGNVAPPVGFDGLKSKCEEAEKQLMEIRAARTSQKNLSNISATNPAQPSKTAE